MVEWSFYRGEYDAPTNLALDELALRKAQEGDRTIRVYDFERPAIILARNESFDVVKTELEGVDYSRRDTGGSVIYCDDNALFYSVAMPADANDYPERLHRDYFGPRIASALADVGVPEDILGIGEHFSVRVEGRTVSGNSQRKVDDAVLYHGVLALEKWDVELLDSLIELRERGGESEKEFIASLPGISDYVDADIDGLRERTVEYLVHHLSEGEYHRGESLMADSAVRKLVREKYGDRGWVYDARGSDSLKKNQGFCFVDWTDEWDEEVRDYGFY